MTPQRQRLLTLAAVSVPLVLVAAFAPVHGQGFGGRPDPRPPIPGGPRSPFGGPRGPTGPSIPPPPQFPNDDFPRGPRGFEPPRGRDPFGGGTTITEWRCSGCNAVLGTGSIKPSLSSCPQCGARFTNGGGFRSSPIGPSAPSVPSDPFVPSGPSGPSGPSIPSPLPARSPGSSLFFGVSTVLVILAGGLLLIGAAVGIVLLIIFVNKKGKPKLKKRRRLPPREAAYPEARQSY